jgi:hypothetical protein
MKTKKTIKKLVLNKETVSILTENDLQAANGGATLVSRCNSQCLTCAIGIIC